MAGKLVVKGIPPYDGEYPVEDSGFTTAEYHAIKQISGVRAGELEEAMAAGDVAVFVALSSIILTRAGFVVQLPLLWEAKEECLDFVEVEDGAAEDVGRPPTTATPGGNASAPDVAASETETSAPSGPDGTATGAPSPPIPPGTGSPGSVTSADSDQPTSEA